MSLTKPTSNLMSNIMLGSKQPKPEVGMGATICMYTDRHAATIIEVVNEKTIKVQRDISTRIDNNGMSDQQKYEYSQNPNGTIEIFTLRKNGCWCRRGGTMNGVSLVVGVRKAYHDYSF